MEYRRILLADGLWTGTLASPLPCSLACWFTLHSGLARFHYHVSQFRQFLKIKFSIFICIPLIHFSREPWLIWLCLDGFLTFLLLWIGVNFLVCVLDVCVQGFFSTRALKRVSLCLIFILWWLLCSDYPYICGFLLSEMLVSLASPIVIPPLALFMSDIFGYKLSFYFLRGIFDS